MELFSKTPPPIWNELQRVNYGLNFRMILWIFRLFNFSLKFYSIFPISSIHFSQYVLVYVHTKSTFSNEDSQIEKKSNFNLNVVSSSSFYHLATLTNYWNSYQLARRIKMRMNFKFFSCTSSFFTLRFLTENEKFFSLFYLFVRQKKKEKRRKVESCCVTFIKFWTE